MAKYVSPRSRRAKALMGAISGPESAGQYDRRYHPTGIRRFSDYSAHPGIGERIGAGPNEGKFSTAAGKYQITKSTWGPLSRDLGLTDFSPQSQDIAGWGLAQRAYGAGLDQDLASMDPATLGQVGAKLAKTWTSLPGGIENQIGKQAFANSYLDHYSSLAPTHPETTAQALTSPAPMASQYAPDAGMWSGPAKFGAPIGVDAPDVAAGRFTADTMPGALTPSALSPMSAPVSSPAAPPSAVASAPSPTEAERQAAFGALRTGLSPNVASVQSQSMPGLTDAQVGMAMSPDDMRSRIATAHGLAPGPNIDGTFGQLAGLGAPPSATPSIAAAPTAASLGMSPTAMSGPAPLGNFGTMPGAVSPMSASLQSPTVANAPQQAAPASAAPSTFGAPAMTGPAPMSTMGTMPGAIGPLSAGLSPTVSQPESAPSVAAPQSGFGAPPASISAPAPMAAMAPAPMSMTPIGPTVQTTNPQETAQATSQQQSSPEVSITAGMSSPADFARAMAAQTAAKKAAVSATPESKQSIASKIAGALGMGSKSGGMGGSSTGGSSSSSSSGSKSSSKSSRGVSHGGKAQGSAHSSSSHGKRGTGASTRGGR